MDTQGWIRPLAATPRTRYRARCMLMVECEFDEFSDGLLNSIVDVYTFRAPLRRSFPWLGAPTPSPSCCSAPSYASSGCSRWRKSLQYTLPGARAIALVQPSSIPVRRKRGSLTGPCTGTVCPCAMQWVVPRRELVVLLSLVFSAPHELGFEFITEHDEGHRHQAGAAWVEALPRTTAPFPLCHPRRPRCWWAAESESGYAVYRLPRVQSGGRGGGARG
jgi:hypothetical protein